MPARIVSTANTEHYMWGRPGHVDAWYLIRTPELNVIEERMPPGVAETPHHHVRSRQFFYVLQGELAMQVEHHDFVVRESEGIEVAPGQMHMAANRSGAVLRILVTSQPPSHEDRVEDSR